jgi:tripartite-type tricarboxylate transporter receptor subunit TctC
MNGHNMIVENRVGASGGTAMVYMKDQKPDGYTIMGTSTTLVLSSVLHDLPVKYTDFKFVCGMVFDPEYFYCGKNTSYSTIQELIDYCKAHPGEVKFGFPMAASSEALAMTVLIETAGIDVKSVVFENGTECYTSLLGGHIDVSVGSYSDFGEQYKTGDIKVMATLLGKSTSALPNVPALKDCGLDIELEKIRGIIAPKDTPDEIIEELSTLFKHAYDDASFTERLKNEGCEVGFVSGPDVKESYDKIAQFALEKLKP